MYHKHWNGVFQTWELLNRESFFDYISHNPQRPYRSNVTWIPNIRFGVCTDTWHSCSEISCVLEKRIYRSQISQPKRLTGPRRAGQDGGGPPYADDLAGPEGGWGVPVQRVRQAGEHQGGGLRSERSRTRGQTRGRTRVQGPRLRVLVLKVQNVPERKIPARLRAELLSANGG